MTIPDIANRSLYTSFRVNLVRLLLAASWGTLAWLTASLYRNGSLDQLGTWLPLVGLVLALAVLTALPWRRVLRRPVSDALFVVWAAAALAAMVFSQVKGGGSPLVVVYALVIVIGAALLIAPLFLAVVAALSMLAYVLAATRDSSDISQSELVSQLVALMFVGLITIVLAYGLRRQIVDASNRLTLLDQRDDEVRRRESQLEQMYAVSRTIGAGSNLAEVIPELVGRVVGVLEAKTGVVLLYKPKGQILEVLSPIWVAGQPLRVEGHMLALTEASFAQRVFTSGEPALETDVATSDLRDSLLVDLDARQVAAVPLQVESRRIGVLLIADKNTGKFDRTDLATLESLAAPAALVLNQLSRFEEAQETGAKMAELARLKTDFVSVVSHELRTPLTSIIGSLQTLERPELAPADPNARKLLSTASRQAERLRTLIEDLLVVSRIDNQALPVRPESIALTPFISDLVGDTPNARGQVTITLAPSIDTVEADPDHLRRIMTNLLVNALRYSRGSTIDVATRDKDSEIWLSVADRGPGIPYELHDHIFDRFTQVDRVETQGQGGTGMGLSIVRGLAQAMGGRVWFEPTIGGGATFVLALPKRARSYQSRSAIAASLDHEAPAPSPTATA